MTSAIILNLAQAECFARSGKAADDVFSFCPSATHFLAQKNMKVTSAADVYGALSHGRTTVAIARELPRIMEAAIAQYSLDYAAAEGLRVYLYHYLSRIYYLFYSLRSRRRDDATFYWVHGDAIRHGGWEPMFLGLAAVPAGALVTYAYTDYGAAHYRLAALYNRILARKLARSARLKLLDFGDELPKRIVAAAIKNGEDPIVVHTHKLGKNPLLTTRFFLKSLARLGKPADAKRPVMLFRAAPPADYRKAAAPFTAPALASAAVSEAVRLTVTSAIAFMRTEAAMGRGLVRAIAPDIIVSDHAKYPYILGGLEEHRGPHAMLNHGTHTMQYDRLSQLAARLWGEQQRIINRNTTHSLPKSPLTELLAREIRSDANYETVKVNVYGRIESKASADGPFVILQAGNYTDAYNHIPWCKETADEYLLAICELLEDVAKLDHVELIIKLKNKKADTHRAIVEGHIRRLGIEGKARVDTTGKFSELMARAHLIVCNVSGTIEEALANHIPLMIHTYRKSYFHIAPETVAASAIDGMAPAYLVRERADIGKIIGALTARRGELNDPRLYAKVAWQQKQLTSMEEFARNLVQSARETHGG